MLRFRNGLISMILFCSIILLGFINTSNADIEIESVGVYPYLDSDDHFSMYVYVQMNEPYYEVNYYLDDTWIGSGYGGNGQTYDCFCYDESSFGGELQGTEHTLRVDVCAHDDDWNWTYDTVTETFKVYKPDVNSGYGSDTGVYGETELSQHSYEHPYITFYASVWAQNDTEFEWTSSSKFRHDVKGPGFSDARESNPPAQGISKNGGTYGPFYESYDQSMEINISGGNKGEYTSYVYIRHDVSGNAGGGFKKDNWDILTDHTFTW